MIQEGREEKAALSRPLAKAQTSIVMQFPFQLPLHCCPMGKRINTPGSVPLSRGPAPADLAPQRVCLHLPHGL